MNYQTWLFENRPLLAAIDAKYPRGIKPDAKYGSRETICGSWINWHGEPSDTAAMTLNVSEQYLIDYINGITRRQVRAEYYNSRRGPDFAELFKIEMDKAATALNEFFSIESEDIKMRW